GASPTLVCRKRDSALWATSFPRSPAPRRSELAPAARPATPEGRRRRDAGAAERTRGEERSRAAPDASEGKITPHVQSNSDARGGVLACRRVAPAPPASPYREVRPFRQRSCAS